MHSFDQLNLSNDSLKILKGLKFDNPTPIQEKVIPVALQGNDVMGTAQTGSGKTLSYILPIVEKLRKNVNDKFLILAPTRELSEQVFSVAKIFLGHGKPFKAINLIGGKGIFSQINQLKKNPQIIIGTPGRINDLLERKSFSLSKCSLVVLDEMDRMLDMGFGYQVDKIMKQVNKNRQMIMLSATIPTQIRKVSSKYLNNPVNISIENNDVIETNIKQKVIKTIPNEKVNELINQIDQRKGSILIFAKTKIGVDKLVKKLKSNSVKASALHGGMRQNKRSKIMQNFRDERFRILVATDIASRGLDVPHIEHIINYDMPQAPEDFIHRIGRTARAGSVGEAVSFLTQKDTRIWRSIERLLNKEEFKKKKGNSKYENNPELKHKKRGRSRNKKKIGGRN
ncbi:MAG: DEAD/DEAH box helicase [Chloroflexota bacterium]|nr:DEAD/DEAH box helicase [Chloroflexota bacterium]